MPFETYRLSRPVSPFERDNPNKPLAPLNVFVMNIQRGVYDIRWDNPGFLGGNGKFDILGVNIYRSFDSQLSNYTKINTTPVGSLYYRDSTENRTVTNEDVSDHFTGRGVDHPEHQYIIKVAHYPIVKPGSQGEPTDHIGDVTVRIDGVVVKPLKVKGRSGEIYLDQRRYIDPMTRTLTNPTLPDDDSVVTVTYQYNVTTLSNALHQRMYYKVTTVAMIDAEEVETPLTDVDGVSVYEIEKLDYIWKEAIRRNRWILEQGGEAVKVFLRKWVGTRCRCWSDTHKQAEGTCLICYGTSIEGGYEGPFDILVAPQDGERRIELSQNGMNVMHQYEVWTGPNPLLSQRDFVVRQNGDRYTIGPVNVPSNRGTILQQSFSLGYISERDIRYTVSAQNDNMSYPQTRQKDWNKPGVTTPTYPQITESGDVPDGREDRGRTPTYGRIMRPR